MNSCLWINYGGSDVSPNNYIRWEMFELLLFIHRRYT